MPSEITKRIYFLTILVCITANCLAQEKTKLPEIKVIEVEEGGSNAEEVVFRVKIELRSDRIDPKDKITKRKFIAHVKQFVSKEQGEYLEKREFYIKNGLSRSRGRQSAIMNALSIKDAEIMAHKFIEFYNDLAEKNLKNLPNELIEAKKQLEELKQKKLKAEEELSEVNTKLEGIREYPSEYTDADMERVKTEFNDLRFLKKKTDIEIAGIKARIERAKAALSGISSKEGDIRQQVMNSYTEAQITYADAQARSGQISSLVEKYLLAITLYNKSRKLPETIGSLARMASNKNNEIFWLEAEINDPQRNLRGRRKPLQVLDITIYDNSKNLKN